jgi:hypothetical protein
VPVLDHLVWISAGLVPEPALCPGAGVAERSQETLYSKINFFLPKNLNFYQCTGAHLYLDSRKQIVK